MQFGCNSDVRQFGCNSDGSIWVASWRPPNFPQRSSCGKFGWNSDAGCASIRVTRDHNINNFKHQNTLTSTAFQIFHIHLNCHILFYFSKDFLWNGLFHFFRCLKLIKEAYFLRFENFGNLLSPSWRILNESRGQWIQNYFQSQIISVKKINSMRFSASSVNGIFFRYFIEIVHERLQNMSKNPN